MKKWWELNYWGWSSYRFDDGRPEEDGLRAGRVFWTTSPQQTPMNAALMQNVDNRKRNSVQYPTRVAVSEARSGRPCWRRRGTEPTPFSSVVEDTHQTEKKVKFSFLRRTRTGRPIDRLAADEVAVAGAGAVVVVDRSVHVIWRVARELFVEDVASKYWK